MGKMSLNWLNDETFNTYYSVAEFVDPVTKVHYLVFFDNNRDSSSICPRYNADGTIMKG